VYFFGKFGVEPDSKGRGIGRALFEAAEAHARECGAHTFCCDTAVPATELIDLYRRWGFEIVDRQQWSVTNYPSVVLAKPLN
jgi:ribosomal protein S18 acetylase RimI-like enzyme